MERKKTGIPERWGNGKKKLEAPKQKSVSSPWPSLARKKFAWKRQAVGSIDWRDHLG